MSFKFKHQKILDFAELQENMKKMEIARVQKSLSEIKQKMDGIQKETLEILRTSQALISESEGRTYRTDKVLWNEQERKSLEKALKDQEELLEEKLFEFSKLKKRKEAIEALKQKREIEHKKAENKKEQSKSEELHRMAKQADENL